jgi:hypothetical protein
MTTAREKLIAECEKEEENCLYTSTTFYIWIKVLRTAQALVWVIAAVGSAVAASHILRGDENYKIVVAAAAIAGAALPGIGRALRIESAIKDYSASAASYKILQGEFRRAARVWSQKEYDEFETESKKLFKILNEARKMALTPPDFCFRLARNKIKKGHYDHAPNKP